MIKESYSRDSDDLFCSPETICSFALFKAVAEVIPNLDNGELDDQLYLYGFISVFSKLMVMGDTEKFQIHFEKFKYFLRRPDVRLVPFCETDTDFLKHPWVFVYNTGHPSVIYCYLEAIFERGLFRNFINSGACGRFPDQIPVFVNHPKKIASRPLERLLEQKTLVKLFYQLVNLGNEIHLLRVIPDKSTLCRLYNVRKAMLENGDCDQAQLGVVNNQINVFEKKARLAALIVFSLVLPDLQQAQVAACNIDISTMLFSANAENDRPVSPFFNRKEPLRQETGKVVKEVHFRLK